MTDQPCPYSLDGLACDQEFTHYGNHTSTVDARSLGKRTITWEYLDEARALDRSMGYEAVLERTRQAEYVEPEPEPQEEPEPEKVMHAETEAALAARAPQVTRRVAIRLREGNSIDRHDALGISLDEFGNLHVATRTEDVVYNRDAWTSATKEPGL